MKKRKLTILTLLLFIVIAAPAQKVKGNIRPGTRTDSIRAVKTPATAATNARSSRNTGRSATKQSYSRGLSDSLRAGGRAPAAIKQHN